MEIHPVAAAGFADGELYDRARPDYPPGVFELLGRELPVEPGARVLDLGAGTGKLTRGLLALGARVVAVEPLAAMRAQLPAEAEVVEATAEALPLADASVDAAVAGDAWHWFDAERAAAELARVVRPGGAVALLGQRPREGAEHQWAQAMRDTVFSLRPRDPPWQEHGRDAIDARNGFEPLALRHVPYERVLDRDGMVAWISTMSFVAALPDEERGRVLARVRELLPDEPVRMELQTDVWLTRRVPAPPR